MNETARLIHDARSAAARVAEAAAKLDKEGRQRSTGFQKQIEAETTRVKKEHAETRARLEDELEARSAYLIERKKARETRITKAYLATRKQLLDQIDETEGRRKFAVQKGILDEEKRLHARVAEIDQQFKTFQAESAGEREALDQLRESARKSLRAFPFLRANPSNEKPGKDLAAVREVRDKARASLGSYRSRILPELFRFLPIWLWLLAAVVLFFLGPERLGLGPDFPKLLGAAVATVIVLYALGWALAKAPAAAFSSYLTQAEKALENATREAETTYARESESERQAAKVKNEAFQRDWEYATAEATQARTDTESSIDGRVEKAYQQNERLHSNWLTGAEENLKRHLARLARDEEALAGNVRADWEEKARRFNAGNQTQWADLRREWSSTMEPIQAAFEQTQRFASGHFSPWEVAAKYKIPDSALNAMRIGSVNLQLPSPFPADSPAAVSLNAPLLLTLPNEASIVIESDEGGRATAIDTLNNIVYRVLQTVPPGKAAFTLIDPARLGQSFSSIMHLADFEESIVNRRIWTEPGEIEERLLELNAHMEKVIQMYLRNEFENIVDYNKEAGRIAEKYHFLVIADFPASFTDTALRRLSKIAASGARCGVFTLIHWDKRAPLFPGFDPHELAINSVHLQVSRSGVVLPKIGASHVRLELDPPPAPDLATTFLQEVGQASRGSNTVQVPFTQVAPGTIARWSLDTTDELRVPIGRSGATKLQYLSLGKGTRQHVLIAGKTGSGKSTLLHVLVTNLALWASPDQVEFYLVDFKKGVEFKDYATARLPHARVVAIESDREFGLSVLRRVDEELRQRGELFRAVGAQDLAGYKRSSAAKMPRVLLIVDEFQELFVEDDSISQNAALLLDRIVRQGRAFGIHVILGSQTLGGAYSLARSTLGQMAIRIALQTNEADAYLIMDESNPAPRLLSRPGEGIYNDSGGALEANSPFQVVWLPETERRDALAEVRALAERRQIIRDPVVFEGNTLADLRDNPELIAPSAANPTVWLGLPNEIKEPTHVVLDKRSGRNLLIAGQQEDHTRALFASALLSLSRGANQVILLEPPVTGTPLNLSELAARLSPAIQLPKTAELAQTMRTLVEELERRENIQGAPPIFLLIYNLPAFKTLRPEDEFSLSLDPDKPLAAADFQRIYTDGPVLGIHVIAQVDGFNNANRFLGRKGLKEFSLRVLFQMSATDSASFSDDARAGNLGLNRALLYNENEGTYETFRPYARPDSAWLDNHLKEVKGA